MIIVAVDPGDKQTAIVRYDTRLAVPMDFWKLDNNDVNALLDMMVADRLYIEMVASYGMPVGREVFETCVWIGRFIERWELNARPAQFVYRKAVKLHLCGQSRAKDSNVRQALLDKWGGKELAVGKKNTPGPLYGISGDCWSALAVAVTAAETENI